MDKKNRYIDLSTKHDYGFTFSDEDEVINNNKEYNSLSEQVDDLKERIYALKSIFLPLLENLGKEPHKPMIKWPNRKEMIDEQIKRLNRLTDV